MATRPAARTRLCFWPRPPGLLSRPLRASPAPSPALVACRSSHRRQGRLCGGCVRTIILGRGGGWGQGRGVGEAPVSQALSSSCLDAFGDTTLLERPNPRSYALGTELEWAL